MPDLRVFLDANILFTAAYSPHGLSALLIEIGEAHRLTLLTSQLAVIEARRNLELKRPKALPRLDRQLCVVEIVREPGPEDVDRLTPSRSAPKDRPILAAAIVAGVTHFVTGDLRDFGEWIGRRGGASPPRNDAAPVSRERPSLSPASPLPADLQGARHRRHW